MANKLNWSKAEACGRIERKGHWKYEPLRPQLDPAEAFRRSLNRQYRDTRLKAVAEGKSFPAYGDWIRDNS